MFRILLLPSIALGAFAIGVCLVFIWLGSFWQYTPSTGVIFGVGVLSCLTAVIVGTRLSDYFVDWQFNRALQSLRDLRTRQKQQLIDAPLSHQAKLGSDVFPPRDEVPPAHEDALPRHVEDRIVEHSVEQVTIP